MDTTDARFPAGEYQLMAEQVRQVQRELAEIRETAESGDRLISATVDARGRLAELWLDPRIYRRSDSAALTEDILGTYRAACAAAERKAFEVSASLLAMDATPAGTDLAFDPVLRELERLVRETGGAR